MSSVPLQDPIYQLNFTLWMLEQLPRESPFRPLLREIGYALHSIGRSLPLAPEYRLRLAAAGIEAGQLPSPDVVALREARLEYLVIECKAAGFSPGSSTARQARALLVAAADLRGPLGLPPGPMLPGILSYLLPEPEPARLTAALDEIAGELHGSALPGAPYTVFGLEERADGVYLLDRHPDGVLPHDLEMAIGDGARVHTFADGGVWRPLYFIPWDPSVEQAPDEKALCQRILFERVLASAVSHAGRLRGPGQANFSLDSILEEATFELAKRWNRQDILQVITAIRGFLESAIRKKAAHLPIQWDGATRTLRIPIASREDAEALRRALEEGKPAEWLDSSDARQPGLFDEGRVE